MIRLTNAANGKSVYINPEQLTNMEPADDVTKLELVRGVHFVTESPEEVARKVLEWRLAMGRYKHGNGHERHMAEIELQQLAGLKESLADQAERIVKEYLAGLEEQE